MSTLPFTLFHLESIFDKIQTMISKEEVQKIAKLARLELSEEGIEKMQKDMAAILDYFDVLKKAPQYGRQETRLRQGYGGQANNKRPEENVMRKDEVQERSASLVHNLIGQVPDRKDDYIKVKQIL